MRRLLILGLGLSLMGRAMAQPLDEAIQAFNQQKYADAEQHFRQHLLKHPQDWSQLFNMGVSLYQQGKFDEAKSYFEQARQSPDRHMKSRAAYNSSMADIMLKKFDQAEQSLQEALSYDNDSGMYRENLDWVRQQKAEQQPPQSDQKSADQNKSEQQDQQKGEKDKAEASQDSKSPAQDQPGEQGNSPNKPDEKTADQNKPGEPGNSPDKPDEKSADQNKPGEPGKSAEQPDEKATAQNKPGEQGNSSDKTGAQEPESKAQNQAGENSPSPAQTEQDQKSQTGAQESLAKAEAEADTKNQADAGKAQSSGQAASDANQGLAEKVLTEKDLERQQAEKMLRSIEDKIGRYPLGEAGTQGEREKANNGKSW